MHQELILRLALKSCQLLHLTRLMYHVKYAMPGCLS